MFIYDYKKILLEKITEFESWYQDISDEEPRNFPKDQSEKNWLDHFIAYLDEH